MGDKVVGFHKGDRVAGFHETGGPGGTYAEYALCPAHLTIHVPKDVSFEEAATIPLACGTAACGLFQKERGLGLPLPMLPATEPMPLVIYGASGSVGTFALELARKANIHPLICVAGGGAKSFEHLLDSSKGDTVIDYRKGDSETAKGIAAALGSQQLKHALDTVAHDNSSANIANAMTSGGTIARVLPQQGDLPNGVQQVQVGVSSVHSQKEFGFTMYQLFGKGLQQGWLTPRPFEVVRGGLNGVEQALKNLKAGKASAIKYVVRIDETDGLEGMS